MNDIKQLIALSIEIEGLLRVTASRHNDEALSLLADKYRLYSTLMDQYLSAPEVEKPEKELVTAAADIDSADDIPVAESYMPAVEPTDETDIIPSAPAVSHEPNTKLLKAFTLNDRFRFRRELFGGNDADFVDTLALLADMDSFDEAADYLYNDMMWDADSAGVADFMDILSQNMPHR